MKGLPFVLLFTAMTFVSWGAYGPTLHHGAAEFNGHDSMRAFVGVGLAYFLIAVIIPFAILKKSGEVGKWTLRGAVFSLIAGAVGALGALGIIFALGQGGSTIYVMPLVFGFAPIVNTLVTAFMSQTFNQIRPIFVAGIVTAALGASGVLIFKPVASATAHSAASTTSSTTSTDAQPDGASVEATQARAPQKAVNFWGILASIVMAATCWGSYGPMLHIGQGKMAGSRLRPFACVGLAYFFIAVAAPLALIWLRAEDSHSWTPTGMTWSILAGVAGALGALGVILAFNAGGKPYYVMPLVFGFAPVINTFISVTEAGTWSQIKPLFWVSLAVVIAGAITVLTNAPRPKPPGAKKPSPPDPSAEKALVG